jgi:hypothetical protein
MKRFTKSHPLVASYALAIIVVDVLFYSKWHDWSGGWCWGPRLIVPAIIVCHVFIAGFIGAANTGAFRRALLGLLVLASIWINALGALVWYQQVYYFHKDYSSVRYSHPVCASRLLVHKLQGRPEMYACADFGADCSRPAYHADWDNIIRGDSIDFTSFEKYRGLATMWTGIAENFSWKWALLAPVLLLAGSLGCARRLWRITRRS